MKVYLVQHGPCVEKTVAPEQPLSNEGMQQIENLRQFISFLNLEVHHLWHSGKLRAKQTAEILSSSLMFGGMIEAHEGLAPMDAVEPIEKILEQLNQNIMLVGHMPFMGNLVTKLLTNTKKNLVSFVPGTIVCLEQNEQHEWHIQWMLTPDIAKKVLLHNISH
ncbi:phosphohistidine phosphatase SixA [Legionella fallonii]|uniref:Phosphohistidine phosphatase SixA n=1 Tax=Legionella fallonii LLAP-10 TaxID=1212491 RepID=A0A098G295_9GAMM|nr:phosphohistidine phosphatase SixA [Legionella fallonii]CEG56089.1 Phosphohistidine phosphatase SixA [Legionella fallonii LLAP-10]